MRRKPQAASEDAACSAVIMGQMAIAECLPNGPYRLVLQAAIAPLPHSPHAFITWRPRPLVDSVPTSLPPTGAEDISCSRRTRCARPRQSTHPCAARYAGSTRQCRRRSRSSEPVLANADSDGGDAEAESGNDKPRRIPKGKAQQRARNAGDEAHSRDNPNLCQ